jgi:hypothetical protein
VYLKNSELLLDFVLLLHHLILLCGSITLVCQYGELDWFLNIEPGLHSQDKF